MQFEITVHCPELETLALALNGFSKGGLAETVWEQESVPKTQSAPDPEPVTATVAPPTPTYDKETLVRAAAELMDQGRQQDLLQLLARFNVPSMVALDPSQFADFGAALKEIGGKL